MNNNLNILLCAYACEPNKGSEPGVGWEVSTNLAKKRNDVNVFVITRKNNQSSIMSENTPSNLNFIFFDLPFIFISLKRIIPFVRVYYYFWMIGATIKLWNKRADFQLIHHITFVNDWFPSIFILLKNKNNKFIWGPIGSNEKIPSKFIYNQKHKVAEILKGLLIKFLRRIDIFFWICKTKSDIIIGTNENVKKNINLNGKDKHKFIDFPAIGIRKCEANIKIAHDLKEFSNFDIISVGQLRYIKNFHLTIRSFKLFLEKLPPRKRSFIKLQIVGNGRQKAELIHLVKDLGVEKNVIFLGQLKQSVLMKYYQKSDIFLFPTLENAGFVILEAMSKELPIIALDYGGPRQFVKTNKNDQLVNPNLSIEKIEEKLSELLLNLYINENLRKEIGMKNRQTVLNEFTWEKKVNNFFEIYDKLLGNNEQKQIF